MGAIEVDELFVEAEVFFRALQVKISEALEERERRGGGAERFREDPWQHHSGGGGMTRVMIDGTVFEKAGVNYSSVRGTFSDELVAAMPAGGRDFAATGVSLVIHPRNPHVPTVHANFRHIVRGSGTDRRSWFGGGSDLTPYYPRREDAIHFHRVWKRVCDRHAVADHARFKRWCDEYFYLPHRAECRGVGGIFFDYLEAELRDVFSFVCDCGAEMLEAYLPIVDRRMGEPFGDAERRWQRIRRGRYVEFNLLYDRGTMFGLKTGGRVESILMSLPLHVMWGYDESPPAGSPEAELSEFLRPRDWAHERADT